ncbi:HYDIN protein, partial [Alaudala cheleensis]|nr:HYDIN protein [Alaudala cheleensis]
LINKGAIDAPFACTPLTTDVGSGFKVAPEEGIIAPGGIQTIQISFNATKLGWFAEDFQISVAGSPTPVILPITGNVVEPSLQFDPPELHFGDISFGFPYTRTCRLTNTSHVPVRFQLRVWGDGTQPAISSFEQIRRENDPSWRNGIHFDVKPREFTMNPSQGTLAPKEKQEIEVTLCSNTMVDFCQKLLVDAEGIYKGVASLTILARCRIPNLEVYPESVLCYDECLLKEPYEKKLYICNESDLPGCYGLVPQERKEDTPVFYSSPKPCGIIQPRSAEEMPIIIEVQKLGEHLTDVP